MPISFDLEAIRKKHDCKIYFETGMWVINCYAFSIVLYS